VAPNGRRMTGQASCIPIVGPKPRRGTRHSCVASPWVKPSLVRACFRLPWSPGRMWADMISHRYHPTSTSILVELFMSRPKGTLP
jgi:hypothetical protein